MAGMVVMATKKMLTKGEPVTVEELRAEFARAKEGGGICCIRRACASILVVLNPGGMVSTVDEIMRQVGQIDGGESRAKRCLTLVRRGSKPTTKTAAASTASAGAMTAEESNEGPGDGVGGELEGRESQAAVHFQAGDQRKLWGLNALPAPWVGRGFGGGGGGGGGGFGGGGGGGGGGSGGGDDGHAALAPGNGLGDGVDLILDDFSVTLHGADEEIILDVELEAPSGERRSIRVPNHTPTDEIYSKAREFTGLADGFCLQHYYTRLLRGAGSNLGDHGVESGDVIKVQMPMVAGMFHITSGIDGSIPGGGHVAARAGPPRVTVELYDEVVAGAGRVRRGEVSVVGGKTTVVEAVAMIESGDGAGGVKDGGGVSGGGGGGGGLAASLLAAVDALDGVQREELIRTLLSGERRG